MQKRTKWEFIGDIYFNGKIMQYDYVAHTIAGSIAEARRNIGFNAKKAFSAPRHTIVDLVGHLYRVDEKTEYKTKRELKKEAQIEETEQLKMDI